MHYQLIKRELHVLSLSDSSIHKSNNVWALGSYIEFAIFILPVSAHLVRLCNISSNDNVLDVACGTGNTAITAKRLKRGAKVTGVDFTPELLAQAKAEASLAEAEDIEWKEGNVQDLPFEDETFDVVLSSFGHMFAPNPEIAIKEMLRVTKRDGGRIAFATWPSELINGKLFEVMTKYISSSSSTSSSITPSPMQWGNPEVVQKRLGDNTKNIHFERGLVRIPLLSPNHYWKMMSTKSGPIIQAIQTLKDAQKIESLKKDVLQAIVPYTQDNALRLDYLITCAVKK
jgi:ubiquinone/menaquinone biosynthesis C-methylase UbiE